MTCDHCGRGDAYRTNEDGDLACRHCGHIRYATPPLPLLATHKEKHDAR